MKTLTILLILALFAAALPVLADDPPPGYPPPATATPGPGYPAPEPGDILAVSLIKFAPDSAAARRAALPAILILLILILILWRVLRQISRR